MLDVVVGLLGRYDMLVGAFVTAYAARRLYTRRDMVGFTGKRMEPMESRPEPGPPADPPWVA